VRREAAAAPCQAKPSKFRADGSDSYSSYVSQDSGTFNDTLSDSSMDR